MSLQHHLEHRMPVRAEYRLCSCRGGCFWLDELAAVLRGPGCPWCAGLQGEGWQCSCTVVGGVDTLMVVIGINENVVKTLICICTKHFLVPAKNSAIPSSCVTLLTRTPLMGESVLLAQYCRNYYGVIKRFPTKLCPEFVFHTCLWITAVGWKDERSWELWFHMPHSSSDVPAGGQFCI